MFDLWVGVGVGVGGGGGERRICNAYTFTDIIGPLFLFTNVINYISLDGIDAGQPKKKIERTIK